MLKDGLFETGVQRIGAEQELCLIDETGRTAPMAMELLEKVNDPHFTTELAKFNVEINLEPELFTGQGISVMEAKLRELLVDAQKCASEISTRIVITGILPSIRKSDIDIHNITPIPRYKELLDRMYATRGQLFNFRIKGVDELITKTHTVLFEACNTSIQSHLQIDPDEAIDAYNWSQIISGPVLAACTNSPLLLGKRLWKETRIALFQQIVELSDGSTDIREKYSRAHFGQGWLKGSVLDMFRRDIARYDMLISDTNKEDSLKELRLGKIPKLKGLNLFNGTVYKWNRLCYGATKGKPHLRIECRYLPSGPTVKDEMANMAFWWGLMNNRPANMAELIEKYDFDDAKRNFFRAAHLGLDAQFAWIDGKSRAAQSLILSLIDLAREGLRKAGIAEQDVADYMDLIEARVRAEQTGAHWTLKSFEKLSKTSRKEDALITLTQAMYKRQAQGKPVHEWSLAENEEAADWKERFKVVRQVMSTDLCTVSIDDPVDLAANLMDWLGIHHLPVENSQKELVGLITAGKLLKYYNEPKLVKSKLSLGEIMTTDVLTIEPNTPIAEAISLMRKNKVGSLPVTRNNKLVGIVTEHDFMRILESWFSNKKDATS